MGYPKVIGERSLRKPGWSLRAPGSPEVQVNRSEAGPLLLELPEGGEVEYYKAVISKTKPS